MQYPQKNPRSYIQCFLVFLSSLMVAGSCYGFGFSTTILKNATIDQPTSLQFGPDGRLYVAEKQGRILALTVARNSSDAYFVVETEVIDLIRTMPNHNDDGTPYSQDIARQVTGLLVTGSASAPVVYVTSSDPRIGAGGSGKDKNLDTNSGVISRLHQVDNQWQKVDLVRGLPRSEENHASNGMVLDAATNVLYLAQGGNTNAGGPSNNFAFATEYALSAAILSIDLDQIEALPLKTDATGDAFYYDLPTLDDPTRPNEDGQDVGDPFGGNDGLNQARWVKDGPVQVYATGFRNVYDLAVIQTGANSGRMYMFDNGPNFGWGGYPVDEGTNFCTNQYDSNESGQLNNQDALHYVTGAGYYGGHPHPLRGNPAGAGLFRFDNSAAPGQKEIFELQPTTDWPPVPLELANPVECDHRLAGVDDGTLLKIGDSTNGLTEYTAENFDGAMKGNLIAAVFSGSLLRIELSEDGTSVINGLDYLAENIGNLTLDVTAPLAGNDFHGTIWVAAFGDSDIVILEPSDFDGTDIPSCPDCELDPLLDEDSDGYTNADELLNGTNPRSAASRPADADLDLVSDLIDTDDDNDLKADTHDPFQRSGTNGYELTTPIAYDLFNETLGFFGVGFTGLMQVPGIDYQEFLEPDNIIAGGTAGLFTIAEVNDSSATGSLNSLENAFQFGIYIDQFSGEHQFSSLLSGPFFAGNPQGNQEQGIYVGTGDQDNYLALLVHANNGSGGILVRYESQGIVQSETMYPAPGTITASSIRLTVEVDPFTGTARPQYSIDGGDPLYVGENLTLTGPVLATLQQQTPIAFGLMASNNGSAGFPATWDHFSVQSTQSTAAALIVVDPNGNSINTSTFRNGAFKISNLSADGQKITRIEYDISQSFLPDVIFDPDGTAGDAAAKGFTPNGPHVVGDVTAEFLQPHNGSDGDDGYDRLEITFSDFEVGETFEFSVDNDPNSIKGSNNPGPGESGSVSGLELSGTSVRVHFDDGSILNGRLGFVSGTNDRSEVYLKSEGVSKGSPAMTIGDLPSPATTAETSITVSLRGPAGAQGEVHAFESALFVEGLPAGGHQLAPFDANSVIAVETHPFTFTASGEASIDVQLQRSTPQGGIFHISAAYQNSVGDWGSPVTQVIAYADSPTIRINAGANSNLLGQAGDLWLADQYFEGGKTSKTNSAISQTAIAAIYQSERFGPKVTPLGYEIPVANGLQRVSLHFAEYFKKVQDAGKRVFDVSLEGQVLLEDYDIVADVGFTTASTKVFEVQVSDGSLSVDFSRTTQNPKIAALQIETLIPSTDQATYRINAGGAAYTDSAGNLWAADDYYSSGKASLSSLLIAGTEDEPIYQSQRWDPPKGAPLQYSLPVDNGYYQVILHFAETFKKAKTPNIRLFDVTLEDELALDAYDIVAQTGFKSAVTETLYTQVSDGELNIAFAHVKQNPTVSAIEVHAISAPPSEAGASVHRINAGGSEFEDAAGNIWLADNYFNTGKANTKTVAINKTVDDVLFQSERWDPPAGEDLTYTLPVENGRYQVNLFFAETFNKAKLAGVRVFDVFVEDQLMLEDYDITAETGFKSAIQESSIVNVVDGNIDIRLGRKTQNPKISAIEIYGVD